MDHEGNLKAVMEMGGNPLEYLALASRAADLANTLIETAVEEVGVEDPNGSGEVGLDVDGMTITILAAQMMGEKLAKLGIEKVTSQLLGGLFEELVEVLGKGSDKTKAA